MGPNVDEVKTTAVDGWSSVSDFWSRFDDDVSLSPPSFTTPPQISFCVSRRLPGLFQSAYGSRDREIRPRVGGQLKLAEEEENETTRFLSISFRPLSLSDSFFCLWKCPKERKTICTRFRRRKEKLFCECIVQPFDDGYFRIPLLIAPSPFSIEGATGGTGLPVPCRRVPLLQQPAQNNQQVHGQVFGRRQRGREKDIPESSDHRSPPLPFRAG